ANDSDALSWNPAGLSTLNQKEFSFMHSQLEEGLRYEHASLAVPGNSYSFGGSLSRLSYGDIQGYNPQGIATGNQDASALAVRGGMAQSFAQSLSAGFALQYLQETLAEASARTYAVNAGAIYKLPLNVWNGDYRVGISALNLGPGLKFV